LICKKVLDKCVMFVIFYIKEIYYKLFAFYVIVILIAGVSHDTKKI